MTIEEARKIVQENGLQNKVDELVDARKPVVISRDQLVVEAGAKRDMDYGEAFKFFQRNRKLAQEEVDGVLTKQVHDARKNGQDVVIDMTNQVKKIRRRWKTEFSKYHKTIIIFGTGLETIRERCVCREKETGKHIPDNVLVRMCMNFTLPTFAEGYDVIRYRWDKG